MTVLLDPRYLVPPPPAGDGPLDRLRRAVPRFANGPEHARRRAEAVRLLDAIPPPSLRTATRDLATRELAGAQVAREVAGSDRVLGGPAGPAMGDVVEVVPRVPVAVLARALGVGEPEAVAALVPAVAAAYFPGRGGPVGPADAALRELLGLPGVDLVRVGLLVQACEPVAALVRAALARGEADPAAVPAADPPVPATVRWRPDTGETVVVPLAGIPFGAGPRRCPAEPHALALAAGVLDALLPAAAPGSPRRNAMADRVAGR